MTQEQLADKAGFSIYHIRNFEKAKYKHVTLDSVLPILKVLRLQMRVTLEAFP